MWYEVLEINGICPKYNGNNSMIHMTLVHLALRTVGMLVFSLYLGLSVRSNWYLTTKSIILYRHYPSLIHYPSRLCHQKVPGSHCC